MYIYVDSENVDVWSLGVTLIEMAEKKPPHNGVKPISAMFLITYKPAPTLADPEKWSSEMRGLLAKCLVKDPNHRASSKDIVEHSWLKKEVNLLRKQQENRATCSIPSLVDLAKRSKEMIALDRMKMVGKAHYDDDYGDDIAQVDDDMMTTETWEARPRGGSVERNNIFRRAWQTKHFDVSYAKGSPLDESIFMKFDPNGEGKGKVSEIVQGLNSDYTTAGTCDTFLYRKSVPNETPACGLNESTVDFCDDDTVEVTNVDAFRSAMLSQLETTLRIDSVDISPTVPTNIKTPDAETVFLIHQLDQLSDTDSERNRDSNMSRDLQVDKNNVLTRLHRSRSSTVSSSSSVHNTLKPLNGSSPTRRRRKSFVIEIPSKFTDVVDRLADILDKMEDFDSFKINESAHNSSNDVKDSLLFAGRVPPKKVESVATTVQPPPIKKSLGSPSKRIASPLKEHNRLFPPQPPSVLPLGSSSTTKTMTSPAGSVTKLRAASIVASQHKLNEIIDRPQSSTNSATPPQPVRK